MPGLLLPFECVCGVVHFVSNHWHCPQVRTATIDQGGNRRPDDRAQEEEGGDLDLANFMTLDSVGEDGEGIGLILALLSYDITIST